MLPKKEATADAVAHLLLVRLRADRSKGENGEDQKSAAGPTTVRLPRVPARMRGLAFSSVVAVAIVAALLLGPSMLPKAGPPADHLLSTMAGALRDQGRRSATFKGRLTMTGSTAVTQETFSASASVSGSFSGTDIQVEATIPGGKKIYARSVGNGFYLRPPGSAWMFFPTTTATKVVTGKAPSRKRIGGIAELLGKLSALGGQSFEGPTIDGVSTYEVRPITDGIAPADGGQIDALLSNAKESIFIGRRDSLPRRLDLTLRLDSTDLGSAGTTFSSFAGAVDIDLQLDVTGWGRPIHIQAPKGAVDERGAMKQALSQTRPSDEIPSLLGLPW